MLARRRNNPVAAILLRLAPTPRIFARAKRHCRVANRAADSDTFSPPYSAFSLAAPRASQTSAFNLSFAGPLARPFREPIFRVRNYLLRG